MSCPLLSVFMPVYNAEAYLRPAIESVLKQTFSDFEFLIVDDGSIDHSAEIIHSYTDPRIRLIQQDNQGCYPARNRAISMARGEFLASMDADDLSLPARFEKQINYLLHHESVLLVGCHTYGCDQEDTLRLKQPVHFTYDETSAVPHVLTRGSTQKSSFFTCATMMFRRCLKEKLGGYDTRLCFSADVDFIARAALIGQVACLPDYLYVFRLLPHAISGAGSAIQREIISIMAAASSRAEASLQLDQELDSWQGVRSFSEGEVQRLAQLKEERKKLPSMSVRRKQAYYETRLATLLRVNGRARESLHHSLRATLLAPEHLLLDRKLVSNLVKGGLAALTGSSNKQL